MKNGAIEDEGVELTIFTARVGVGRKIAEEGFIEFAAGKGGIENFRIDARGDGAEALLVEVADQFASIAFPDRKKGGHADAGKIFLAVGPEVFEKDVAEGDCSNALVVEEAETVVRRDTMRNCFCWSSACSAIALSLPPLQQKRMGSRAFIKTDQQASFVHLDGKW